MTNVIDLTYEKEAVNPMLLQEELAAVLGEQFAGISTGGGRIRVHVFEDMPANLQAQIPAVIQAHDASQLTSDQQAEADRAAQLEALQKPWAEFSTADKDALLKLLAEQLGVGLEK